jgi:hypothetical protein
MPRLLPDKIHCVVGPDRRSSPSTAPYALSSALYFHTLTNPSSCLPAHIDFYLHGFHAFTNPSLRKSFIFSSIQNPGCGATRPESLFYLCALCFRGKPIRFRYLPPLCSLFPPLALCFHRLAASFPKIPGVWVSRMVLRDTRGWRWVYGAGGSTGQERIGVRPALSGGPRRICG